MQHGEWHHLQPSGGVRGIRDAAPHLGGAVEPMSKALSLGGSVLGPCTVSGALQCFEVAVVSEELFKGKSTCTFLRTMEPSTRCCGPGASSEDQDVQEYLKEEDYS